MLHLHLMDVAGQVDTDPAVWHGVSLPGGCPHSTLLWAKKFPHWMNVVKYSKAGSVEKGNFPAMRGGNHLAGGNGEK
jgi:hypothetical protein